ncbi:phosphate ABC transporter ATP-binding protein PstB [Fructilactobacillus myrtifloralis]|uniref:Phosphate ABC transporter ATP-binding protein PstB n=1 Tax=Fructilactobacillus myrtifloralis TaxID=2940301 RepID=A0ABY5BNP2_9LACO|nr:phosphate ABC transporter ATP-binding protein PstB [Fructilactobacillus myrtifloralis]USS84826.1 phosphate ABC transporter ATP-binding protein PstB [Fructilactobacillus myrtifloralis]
MATYNLDEHYLLPVHGPVALATKHLDVFYGAKQATFDANLQFPKNKITALIGASGSGKSTFLRSLNRLNDNVATVQGAIEYQGLDINQPQINVYEVRKNIGMVFQHPNPFAKSIYENIAFALRENGMTDNLDEQVETSLKDAALWDEVKDKLHQSALSLSGGQQQRLCIARAIAVKPDILLMDEPTSALDPISSRKIETMMQTLKAHYTIIIVTHNMQQAARASDLTAFFHLGHVIEFNKTTELFTNPRMQATEAYISGHFG